MVRWLMSLMLISAVWAAPASAVVASTPDAPNAPGGGQVGNGTSASCDQAALHAKLAGGGLVTFACGGAKTIQFTTSETITVDTTINGAGLITLSGQLSTRLFNVTAAGRLTLQNIVLIDGYTAGSDGGAISNHGSLILNNTEMAENATDDNHSGGAIFSDGPVTITSSALHYNFGGSAGALFANFANARVVISNSTFFDNQATNATTGYGGVIWIGELARLTLTGGSFTGNKAKSGGALYLSPNAVVTITNPAGGTTFSFNDATANGGAIYNQAGILAVTGPVFQSNRALTNTVGNHSGGAIFSESALNIRDTTFTLNRAGSGGALAADRAALTNTVFLSNTAQSEGGGAIFFNSGPVIAGGLFQNNACIDPAGCAGGALYVEGSVTLTDTEFLSNTSQFAGGAINTVGTIKMTGGSVQNSRCYHALCTGGGLMAEGDIFLTNTLVSGNRSQGDGGAASGSQIILVGGRIENNTCLEASCLGGGLSAERLALTGTQVLSNTSGLDGGGAYSDNPAFLNGGIFQNNRCLSIICRGGGLFAKSSVVMADTAFINNISPYNGAGIYAQAALTATRSLFQGNHGLSGGGLFAQTTLALNDTRFTGNTASASGGGALVIGAATVTGGRFDGNHTTSAIDVGGGGLLADGALTVTDTLFINNSSARDGGGVFSVAGSGRLVNVLFAYNTAARRGDAVYIDSSSLGVLHNTLAGLSQPGAAAIYVSSGSVGVTNTIIANYSIGISRTTGTVGEDYNLFFNTPAATMGGVTSAGHSFSGNPAFSNPALDDYHLRAGSAAIDRGVNAGVASDVDGDPRPLDGGFDIGFDEFALRVLYLPLVRR
jgi:fibronectin-binding autotransporter adhesin